MTRTTQIFTLFIGLFVLFGLSYIVTKTPQHLQAPNSALMFETVNSSTFEKQNSEQQRVILDVRTPEEFATGHLPGAKNIDFYSTQFQTTIASLDKNTPYSLYCRSGNRSGQTLELMRSLGFTNVLDLEGGVLSWSQAGRTLE